MSKCKTLSKERLEYLLAIMKKNSIEYSVVNNSYDIRLLPEIKQACKQIKEMILQQGIDEDWLPTPDNINALPEPVRKFIHDLETNTDPAHIVRENILIKDTCKLLLEKLEEKRKVDQAFVNTWANEFATATLANKIMHRRVAYMLKEAGIKVVKK